MNIGIDLGLPQTASNSILHHFLIKTFTRFASSHPEHSFNIYNIHQGRERYPPNLSIAARLPVRKLLGLFKRVNKIQEDYFIECFHPALQLLPGSTVIIPDLSMLIHPEVFARRDILRFQKTLAKTLEHEKAILVMSNYYRELLKKAFSIHGDNIHLLSFIEGSIENPLPWQEVETIKSTYAGGREYFLFAGDLHTRFDLVILLKAFSRFKKWQKSNMQLVIAGAETLSASEFLGLLKTYKYKEDVMIIQNPTESVRKELSAAAYAFIYPALYDPFPLTVLDAIRMQVPVISTDIPEVRVIAGDSIIYSTIDEVELSGYMQRVYKDEGWRREIIRKATVHFTQVTALAETREPVKLLSELITY